jgi:hypothetical protein
MHVSNVVLCVDDQVREVTAEPLEPSVGSERGGNLERDPPTVFLWHAHNVYGTRMTWVAAVRVTKTRQCHADTHSQPSGNPDVRIRDLVSCDCVLLSNMLAWDRLAAVNSVRCEDLSVASKFCASEVESSLRDHCIASFQETNTPKCTMPLSHSHHPISVRDA